MRTAWLVVAVLAAGVIHASGSRAQASAVPPLPPLDCGSVVIVKCDKPDPAVNDRSKLEAARRIESRRIDRATVELDRIIVEGDAERPDSPEQAISRALSRPLVRPGETSYSIGEAAQCTCMNICPPPPFPCCSCSDQPGKRLATSPGWKPTY
jgi:hypothetical protein